MTPSGSTGSHKYVWADIAGLGVGDGPDVCVVQQAHSCDLMLGAELRAGIANPWCALWSVFSRQITSLPISYPLSSPSEHNTF